MKFRMFIAKNIVIIGLILVAIILVFCVNFECNAQNCVGQNRNQILSYFDTAPEFELDTIGKTASGQPFISYYHKTDNTHDLYFFDKDSCIAWVELTPMNIGKLKDAITLLNQVGKQIDDVHWIRTTIGSSYIWELNYYEDSFSITTRKL